MDALTIAEASRRIAAKTLSPVELAKHLLDRIATHDQTLNAFITLTPERALADAQAAERRQMPATCSASSTASRSHTRTFTAPCG